MESDPIGIAAVDAFEPVRLQQRAVCLVRDAIRLLHRWRGVDGTRARDQAFAILASLGGIAEVDVGVHGRAYLILELRLEGAVLGF